MNTHNRQDIEVFILLTFGDVVNRPTVFSFTPKIRFFPLHPFLEFNISSLTEFDKIKLLLYHMYIHHDLYQLNIRPAQAHPNIFL